MNQEKIGKFISKLRKDRSLTQEDLANKLNTTSKSVSRWENGRTLPDISLMLPLCQILGITVDELLNAQKRKNQDNIDKVIIETLQVSEKRKKIIKLIFVTGLIILFFSFFLFILLKYPKIDIYNINLIASKNKDINEKLTITNEQNKIYFVGVKAVQVMDRKYQLNDLHSALKHNQISVYDLQNYFKMENQNNNMEKYILYDGGTTIYKNKNVAAIMCNTLGGNKDMYIGLSDMEEILNGEYCGHEKDNTCYFTRTYKINGITESQEEEYVDVTLTPFQGSSVTVKVAKDYNLVPGNTYEFTFSSQVAFSDIIHNIFKYATLVDVQKTDKIGLEQKQEKICLN